MQKPSPSPSGPFSEHVQQLVTSASLMRAPHFVQPSPWLVHVPWLQYVVESTKPASVVEVGTRDGVAFANVCDTVQALGLRSRCYSVTNNSVTNSSVTNREKAGATQALFEQFREHCASEHPNSARILETSSDRARGRFEAGSVDMLLLTMDAEQDDPKALTDVWLPTLSTRGVLWVSTNALTSAVEAQLSALRAEYPHVSFTLDSALSAHDTETASVTLFLVGTDLTETKSDSQLGALNYVCGGMTEQERTYVTTLLSRLGAACEQALTASERNPMVQTLATQLDELSALKAFHQQEHAKHAQVVAALKRRAADLEHKLDEKHRELAQLTQMVLDLESTKSAAAAPKPTAPQKVTENDAKHESPGVGTWLSKRLKGPKKAESVQEQVKLVRQSRLFNADWYLQQNPDVADAGAEPATHFTRFGGFEQRDPSPEFSLRWYCQQYPEVTSLGVNPLVHYLKEGQRKGYKTKP